ncbi:hypothetical protein HRG_005945 [Hirsutella rhossiliensis]|uniref:Uncharacterized protein n=1 Tax=Hirsutella rhossiliensis TaxID=111463 RepID=A0A9P8MY81_9HYPO|nr:uncharacterized protein HRG_05945 [Hirsutella rhossiliensis]KAH0963435.1 hypothetical protein HRG_05945 [Hirsutella rhossiliensis]
MPPKAYEPGTKTEFILREKTRACKQLFQKCLHIPDIDEDDWLAQKSAEFNLCTSGLKADKHGPDSLDSRLRLRPDIRDVVADLLDGLVTALSKYQEIDRSPSSWSDMSDSIGSRPESRADHDSGNPNRDLFQEQRLYVETNLEILIRIHAAIKKSGLKLRNQRADDELKRAEENYQLQKVALGEHQALYGSDGSIGHHERFRRFLNRLVLRNGYTESLIRYIASNIQAFIVAHGTESEDDPYLILQEKLLVIFRAHLYDPARLTTVQRRLIDAKVERTRISVEPSGRSRYLRR